MSHSVFGDYPGATGDVALEKVISMKPDAYIVSGSQGQQDQRRGAVWLWRDAAAGG